MGTEGILVATTGSHDTVIPLGRLHIDGMPTDQHEWVVRWYLGIVRNPTALSEPGVLLLLTSVKENRVRQALIGLTHIGQVRLNSIWQGGRFVRNLQMLSMITKISGDAEAYNMIPATAVGRISKISPTSEEAGLLNQGGSLTTISLGNKQKLLFPTIELFSRCYGRSQYVTRILATLPFDDAVRALIVPDAVPHQDGCWLVTMHMHCSDEDAVFLAHLRHEAITRDRVRKLCGQFQAARVQHGSALVMPALVPWWPTNTLLKYSGVSLTSEPGTFLVFRIDGMSEPEGPPIFADRNNTNLTEATDASNESTGGSGWGRYRAKGSLSENPLTLTHTLEPSGAFDSKRISDPSFEILGSRRNVERVVRPASSNRAPRALAPIGKSPSSLSGGAIRSGTDRPAPARIEAPTELHVSDVAQELWKAIVDVIDMDCDLDTTIESWTGTSWIVSEDPIGAPFLSSDVSDAASWCYVRDASRRKRSRYYYLAKVANGSRAAYFFETERRSSQNNNNATSSEQFRGLAFTLSDDAKMSEVVYSICEFLKLHKGVLVDIDINGPDDLLVYTHRFDKNASLKVAVRRMLLRFGLIPTKSQITTAETNKSAHP